LALEALLVIDQNSDFSSTITLTDVNGNAINLATFTVEGYMKKSYASDQPSFPFNVATSNAATGNVIISLSSANSANMDPGRYVFDLDMFNANNRTRVLQGTVLLTPSVI
jgi:hypothetical protein